MTLITAHSAFLMTLASPQQWGTWLSRGLGY